MNEIISKEQEKNKRKQGNPNFKKGFSGNPKGRPKGAKDKINKNIKENFEAVFEKLGGINGFLEWANKNTSTQSAFYQMYSKMLPSNVGVELSGEDGEPVKIEFVPVKKKEKK